MGILDDAIREHLDLKRKHGAGGAELQSMEDEAFGGGERPDPFAAGELFGETSEGGQATAPPGEAPKGGPSEDPTRVVGAASAAPELEEPPPPPPSEPSPSPEPPLEPEESASLEELMTEDDSAEAPGPQAAPPPPPPPDTAEETRPGGEEAELPARELVGEPESEVEDVAEVEIEADAEDDPGAVPPPPPPPPEGGPEPPGRARGRVDVPTQEFSPPPLGTDERDALDEELVQEASEEDQPGGEEPSDVYDFATDEEPFAESPPARAEGDDFEALGPVTDEPATGEEEHEEEHDDHGQDSEEFEAEDYTDEHTDERPPVFVRDPDDTDDFSHTPVRDPDDSDEFEAPALPDEDEEPEEESDGEDILAGSPDFVEDGEDEDLWFEKGPPKDFDFEDEDEEK